MGKKRSNSETAEASVGHNSNLNEDQKIKLSGYISEIERVDHSSPFYDWIRAGIYKAAKENGFDNKALKEVIKLRRMEATKREAFQNAVDSYLHAMGDFASTPLGQTGLLNAIMGTP